MGGFNLQVKKMFKVKKMDQKTRTMAKMCSQNVLHGNNDAG
jgi:hypothetical protein